MDDDEALGVLCATRPPGTPVPEAVAPARRLRTHALEQGVVDALGDGLEDVIARCQRWSEACIGAGALPSDPLKRAAG